VGSAPGCEVGPYIEVLRIFPGGCDVDGLSFTAYIAVWGQGNDGIWLYIQYVQYACGTILNWERFSFNCTSVLIQKGDKRYSAHWKNHARTTTLFKTSWESVIYKNVKKFDCFLDKTKILRRDNFVLQTFEKTEIMHPSENIQLLNYLTILWTV
jgi:hypothetical protein